VIGRGPSSPWRTNAATTRRSSSSTWPSNPESADDFGEEALLWISGRTTLRAERQVADRFSAEIAAAMSHEEGSVRMSGGVL